jgi:AAA domain
VPLSASVTVLIGAPGAGKTTLLGCLRADTRLVALDLDELLEDGTLLGRPIASSDGAEYWPAYNRLWVRIVSMVTRAGTPVVLFAPLTPSEWTRAADETGETQPTPTFALLDCKDAVRVARLTDRGWSTREIDEALADARELRSLDLHVFDNGDRAPRATAAEVIAWVT